LNYRHAFHAGNFADLVKHAALLELLARAAADPAPFQIIDTHAGRGVYDLTGEDARRSGEAAAGIGRLVESREPPPEFAPLVAAVRRLNGSRGLVRYPGSPWLATERLRAQDSWLGCELRAAEHAALRKALAERRGVETVCADGFDLAGQRCSKTGRVLVLVDPPFERADDYARTVATAAAVVRKNPAAQALVWLPLKDLETLDAFLRDLEDAVGAPILVAETRMRPLTDPLRMNGCALVLIGGDNAGLTPKLETIYRWAAESLGEGGSARVYGL
jgi:23S rRNA (adenine2030-N6)-methyltransferase